MLPLLLLLLVVCFVVADSAMVLLAQRLHEHSKRARTCCERLRKLRVD